MRRSVGACPLCLSGDSSVLMDLHFALRLYSSEQYSVHRFSISRSSVRHFPERSWIVVGFPCLTVVRSFTIWYALLLLFFLGFCSVSLTDYCFCRPVNRVGHIRLKGKERMFVCACVFVCVSVRVVVIAAAAAVLFFVSQTQGVL